jgi:hypothetical protein
MTIAEFKRELAGLIKKGSVAGLSIDDMADELTEAVEGLPSIAEKELAGSPAGFRTTRLAK